MGRMGMRVGLAGVGLAAWLGLAGRGVAAEVDVAALKQEAVSEQSVSAAYALWKHYFTQDAMDSASVWWGKARAHAAELMAAASTEAEKAAPETALIGARLGRAATVLGLTKTPEQKAAVLEAMKEAEASDAWVVRGLWRVKVEAKRPVAEVDAAWTAAVTAINEALSGAQTGQAKTLVRDRRLETYHQRIASLAGRVDAAALTAGLLEQMGALMEGASTFARAFHARQMMQRYAGLQDWPKTVEWAKEAAGRYLEFHPDDRGHEAEMSLAHALGAYSGAGEKDAGLAAGIKAFADWAASWVEGHATIETRETREALFRAYDAAGEHGLGDEWHLKFLVEAFAGVPGLASDKARAARWTWIEGRASRRLFRQGSLVRKDATQKARLVAHGDALRALLVAPNDRIDLMNSVVKAYDDAGAPEKGTALFAALVSGAKARLSASPEPKTAGDLARVLAERIELLRYRHEAGKAERLGLLGQMEALLKANAEARSRAAAVWRQHRLLRDRAKADEWYGLVHEWDVQAFAGESDAGKRAALYADLKEHMLERLNELRSFRDAGGQEAQLAALRKELQPGAVPGDLLLLQRAYWLLGKSGAGVEAEIATYEGQLAAAAAGDATKGKALVEGYYWERSELQAERQPPLGGMNALRKAVGVCPDDGMRLKTYHRMVLALVGAGRFVEARQVLESVKGQFGEEPLKTQVADLLAWVEAQRSAAGVAAADRGVRIQVQVLEQKIKLLETDLKAAQAKGDAPRVAGLQQKIDALTAERHALLAANP